MCKGIVDKMPKGNNQKLKLIHMIRILTQHTDEKHSITMPQIIEKLRECGVTAERKSLYDDIEIIRELGIDVQMRKEGRNYYYNVVGKQFEIAELKLLVDAIQSSKFITKTKSEQLIKKLETHASIYEARSLNRQILVTGRIKTMNESIFYNIDELHEAIAENKKIQFKYYEWDINKEFVPRKNGKVYEISPWGLVWDNDNYYLIAYDKESEMIKHYRVDKMKYIKVLNDKREGKKVFDKLNISKYTEQNFGMFAGEGTRIVLKVRNDKIGIIIDRFGKDVVVMPDEEGYFKTTIYVAMSDQFLGWIFGLGDGVQIISPKSAVDRMKEKLYNIKNMYESAE